MQSKAKGEYAYTILDVTGDVTGDVTEATGEHLENLPEIIRARVIK